VIRRKGDAENIGLRGRAIARGPWVRRNRDDESSLEDRNAVASAGHADRSIDEQRCRFRQRIFRFVREFSASNDAHYASRYSRAW